MHRRGPGRPGIMLHKLIVRMVQDSPSWGYTRIQGAMGNLSHQVGRGTIANVIKRNGIEPSPERSRRTPWPTFLEAHWKMSAPRPRRRGACIYFNTASTSSLLSQ